MAAHDSGTLTVTTPTDREITFTRRFKASRDLVFEAHSSCEHMSHWWGPRGYEITFCDLDFRPGGAWRIVQRGPDGTEYGFRGEFREIVQPERITWTFEFDGVPGHVSVQTVTFEEREGVTTLAGTAVFDSVEDREGMIQSGMEAGMVETYERLEEYLEVLGAR